MFYYLHFTRPPPEEASPSQPLFITPNIANDLRTEFPSPGENGGIDIYYSWVKCADSRVVDPEAQKTRALGPMTQPQRLMTWTGNSYKEVQVFPPKEARVKGGSDGSRWSLLLCTRSSSPGQPYVTSIDLSADSRDFGNYVFPILSMPVRFTSGNTRSRGLEAAERKGNKQVRNERVFKLPSPLLNADAPSVGPLRVTEHLSYDLDKKVWDSGVALSNWLVSSMVEVTRRRSKINPESDELVRGMPTIVQDLMQTKGATILELGTGTGLVSLVLATLLSHCPEQSHSKKIIATDLQLIIANDTLMTAITRPPPSRAASAMEILEANLSDNAKHWQWQAPNLKSNSGSPPSSIQARSAVLDWDEEDEEKQLPVEILENGVDFIIMADVTYNTASFPSLIRTLSRLSCLRAKRTTSDASRSLTPAVLLAYKERDPDERKLWDMARDIGLHFTEIDRVTGAGGVPVEIYSGRFE